MNAPLEDVPFLPCGAGCLCAEPQAASVFPGEACLCDANTVYRALIWWRRRAVQLGAQPASQVTCEACGDRFPRTDTAVGFEDGIDLCRGCMAGLSVDSTGVPT